MRIILGLGIAALALAGVGCDRDRGDTDLHRNIRAALDNEAGLRGVDVDVRSDRIQLEGTVANEDLRARAETIARKYAAGKSIENKLRIGAPRSNNDWGAKTRDFLDDAGEKTRDALDVAADKTRKAIRDSIDFVQNLDIRVNGKKVTLHGLVDDEDSRVRAERIARDNGAEEVDNQIKVKDK